MAAALVAYLHFLAIFALFALLSVEHVLFKAPLDLARARSLMITDLVYGICAGLVLATGVARVLWFGKGAAYYMGNSLFHAKLGLFILVGLLSIVPTVVFIKWRKTLKTGQVPAPSAGSRRLACHGSRRRRQPEAASGASGVLRPPLALSDS